MGGAVGTRGSLAAPFLLALVFNGPTPGVTHAAEGAEILPGDPHGAVVAHASPAASGRGELR